MPVGNAAVEGRSLSAAGPTDWNPFEDPAPFNQLTEDHLFGAEFDKIKRGSQSSKKCVTVANLFVCVSACARART